MLRGLFDAIGGVGYGVALPGLLKHTDIVEVIAESHGFFLADSQDFLELPQSVSFICRRVHEIDPTLSRLEHPERILPALLYRSPDPGDTGPPVNGQLLDLHRLFRHIFYQMNLIVIALHLEPLEILVVLLVVDAIQRGGRENAVRKGSHVGDQPRHIRLVHSHGIELFAFLHDVRAVSGNKNNIIKNRIQKGPHAAVLTAAGSHKKYSFFLQFPNDLIKFRIDAGGSFRHQGSVNIRCNQFNHIFPPEFPVECPPPGLCGKGRASSPPRENFPWPRRFSPRPASPDHCNCHRRP